MQNWTNGGLLKKRSLFPTKFCLKWVKKSYLFKQYHYTNSYILWRKCSQISVHKAKSIGWIFLELHCPQIVKLSFQEKRVSSFLVTWRSVAKPTITTLIFRISFCGFGSILLRCLTIDLCKKKIDFFDPLHQVPPFRGILPCWAEKSVILVNFLYKYGLTN